MLPNSFYKANHTLIPKPDKDIIKKKKKKKLPSNIFDKHKCKNPLQSISSQTSNHNHETATGTTNYRHTRTQERKGQRTPVSARPGQDAKASHEGKNTSFITGRENHLKHLSLIQTN